MRKEVQDKRDKKNSVTRAQSQELPASETDQSTPEGPAKRGGGLFHDVADQNATSRRITTEIQLRNQELCTIASRCTQTPAEAHAEQRAFFERSYLFQDSCTGQQTLEAI